MCTQTHVQVVPMLGSAGPVLWDLSARSVGMHTCMCVHMHACGWCSQACSTYMLLTSDARVHV